MTMSFSVPVMAFPQRGDENAMEVDSASTSASPPRIPPAVQPTCDVQGCTSTRKYRLVRDFQKGACGMGHLKQLEAQIA